MKKAVQKSGHWGADSPDGQPVMVAYWNAQFICSYANAACLNWFGIPPLTDVGSLQLQDLFEDAFLSFQAHARAALQGESRNFELERAPRRGGVARKAMFRLAPDFSDEGVRGFMLTAIDLPLPFAGKEFNGYHDEGYSGHGEGDVIGDALNKKLMQYSDKLGTLLSLYLENGGTELKPMLWAQMEPDEHAKRTSEVTFDAEINLYDCITRAVDSLAREIKTTETSVRVRVSPFIYVHANSTYMESIIYTFIGNALLHRPAESELVIELSSMVVGDETVLSIKDNGKGIDLNAFYGSGARDTDLPDVEAPGNRLHTVRQQVYAIGGHIGVESQKGSGTWFRIYLKTKAPM